MDKRILIPTDFSKNALNATRYALDLYGKLNCEFYFLNVFRLESYTMDTLIVPEPGSAQYEAAKIESEEGFLKLFDMLELHQDNPKHTYHTISTFNFLSEAIKQMVANKDIDLVVMGTKGVSGNKGVIFGSNTVNTMEKVIDCPVLAIPEEVRFSPLKEIVFPTNYKSVFKRKELKCLLEIANIHEASIRFLYVHKKPELTEIQQNNKQLLEDILEATDHSFHNISNNNIAKSLTTFVESRNSNMIAFINHKHFFFGSVFSKPLVKQIGYDPTVPIMALP